MPFQISTGPNGLSRCAISDKSLTANGPLNLHEMALNLSQRGLSPILIVTRVDDVKIIASQQDADAFINHFRQLYDIKGFSSPQQFQDERALTMSALPNDLRFSGG